jgi:hypothetical protein
MRNAFARRARRARCPHALMPWALLSAGGARNPRGRPLGRAEILMAGEADPPPHRPRHAASPTSPPDGRRGASGAGSSTS